MLGRVKFELSALVNEMLDHLPEYVFQSETTTFLDPCMGGGQFVKEVEARLRRYGHSTQNISRRVFGVESNQLRVNYAINKHGLVGQYRVHENYLEHDENMKFDVVIGNPPYQDPDAKSSKKLWPAFVDYSFGLLLEGGFLMMVTPASWMAGNSPVFDIVTNHNCFYLNDNACSYFKGIGSTFSVYGVQKTKATGSTRLATGGEIDLRFMTFLPRNIGNPVVRSIFDKHVGVALDVKFDSFCHSQRSDRVSRKQSKSFRFPIRHGACQVLWSNNPHPSQALSKVMFYMSGTPKPIYDAGHCGISQHYAYVEVGDQQTANSAISYFQSKLFKFAIYSTSFGQAWNKNYLKQIPAVPFDRNWSDQDLYEHFDLTKEEIDCIESVIK
jgi:hypothetical protein